MNILEIVPKVLDRQTDLVTQDEIENYAGPEFIANLTSISGNAVQDYAFQGVQVADALLNMTLSSIGGFNGVYDLNEETGLNEGHLTKYQLDILKQAICNMIVK